MKEKIKGSIKIQYKILKKKAALSPLKKISGIIKIIINVLKNLIFFNFIFW